jgi:Ala-tRNA(Pro) deacylase
MRFEAIQEGCMSAQTGFQSVTGFLEREGVAFEIVEHERTLTAAAEARAAGMAADDVAKTVMLRDEGGYRLAVIPASRRLDLRKVRHVLESPRGLRLVTESEMASDFGDFEIGALPPFAPLMQAVELMDERLLDHDRILCCGGDHEHGVLLDPLDVVRAGQARVADLCED